MEEETYSRIFTSLKHPIRRRILRLLDEKPLMFSEIQKTLGIDTEHLHHHLEKLGDLTYTDKNGYCRLSTFGHAAVKLMCSVEENGSATCHHKNKPRRLFAKIYPIVLALILVCASIYFVSYVFVVPDGSETTRWAFTLADSTIGVGETLELDFTVTEQMLDDRKQVIGVDVGSAATKSLTPRDNTFTVWYEDSMWIEMEPTSYAPRDMATMEIELNETAANTTSFSGGFWYPLETSNDSSEVSYIIVDFSPELSQPILKYSADLKEVVEEFQNSEAPSFYLVYLSTLSVHIYAPDGTATTDYIQRGNEPHYTVTTFAPSETYWISETSNTSYFSSSEIPINQQGTYQLDITNNGPFRWDENFSLYIKSQRIERPYFYLGISGLVAAWGYIIFVALMNIRQDKPNTINEEC
jgi:DNA-binding transcriptional ArsR family regulator